MNNEIKVGLLIVVALAVLGWLTVASGTLNLGRKDATRELTSTFRDVNGIKEGTLVKMAGVDIGKVTRVELQPNGTAILRFEVRQSVALPADVAAQITSSGLIGEYYLALVPGREGVLGDGGLLAENVNHLPALASADPANVATDFAKMADDMQNITASLKLVLGDPENARKFQDIVDNLSRFSETLGGNNGETVSNLGRATENLAKITEDLRNGKGALGQLLVSDGNETKEQLNGTLNQLNAAVADFREIMAKINGGQGTIGKLVNDNNTAQKFDTALDTFNGINTRMENFKTELSMEGAALTNENDIYKTNATLRLQPGTATFVELGLTGDGFAANADSSNNAGGPYYGREFGNKLKYTAQVGRTFPDAIGTTDLSLRGGIKNSTAGVGADAQSTLFGTGVKYSADLYDFGGNNTPNGNNPHLDLTARANLYGNNIYGLVGYDNVLNSEYGSPMVGVGVKFGGNTESKAPAKVQTSDKL
ncbi:MAG: hypothetical protein DI585_06405 [Pseudomonas fluorescens]|nr:MAG: hypothetical protein DI585_06405 [Pseudomonas fluorescens]